MIKRLVEDPALVFLVLATIFGLIYTAITPPLRAPDEYPHFLRVIELAKGGLIGKTQMEVSILKFTREFREKNVAYRGDSTATYDADLLASSLRAPLTRQDTVYLEGFRASIYTPVPYLPAVALVIPAYHLFDLSPLGLLYVARLGSLAGGILLLYAAIRLSPAAQWSLALIALLPLAVYGRSGVSADTVTLGLAALYLAVIARHAALAGPLTRSEVARLMLLATLLALCKTVYALLAFAAFVLPVSVAGSWGRHLARLALIVLPGQALNAGWTLFIRQRFFSVPSSGREDPSSFMPRTNIVNVGTSPDEQLAHMLAHPTDFLETLWRTLSAPGYYSADAALPQYAAEGLVTGLGSMGRPLPLGQLVTVYALVLLVTLGATPRGAWLPGLGQRTVLAGLAVATTGAALTLLYIQWAPLLDPVIWGFQGRYLFPILPYVAAALVFRLPKPPSSFLLGGLVTLLSVVALSYAALALVAVEYGWRPFG